MFDAAAPDRSDLSRQLPADAYDHLIHTLRRALPPPLTDRAEDLARRDHAAIAGIAALAPANAAEAELAGQFVAASEQAKECLRFAQRPETAVPIALRYRAQSASMMRQANSALRLLVRMQAVRRKLEADPAARDRLAWIEHCATRLMIEALSRPVEAPEPKPADASPVPVAKQQPAPAAEPDLVAAAERYAVAYPERAAAIRRTGRLPNDVRYFDPPEAALARALIAAHTPILDALDGPAIAPDAIPHAAPGTRAA